MPESLIKVIIDMLDALRAVSKSISAPTDGADTRGEDLGVLLAGTRAGAFLAALGEAGRSRIEGEAP